MSTLTADPGLLGYVGKLPDAREADEWYTPAIYIEAARRALGSIDLDPFSSEAANATVRAREIFTLDNPAENSRWARAGQTVNVFANPPYGRSTLRPALATFLRAWNNGEVRQAIILVNNMTETLWFHELLEEASAICLVKRRISFWTADGKTVSGNTRGQVFLYFGTRPQAFNKSFNSMGRVCFL